MRKKTVSFICLIMFLFISVQTLSAKKDKGWTTCVSSKKVCVVIQFPGEPDIVFYGTKKRPR
jgi:hypothetical protein